MSKQPLNEGLRANDLKDLIYPQFEVDTFRSKMGEDKDVVTLTFQAKDRYPAKDMMEFIERGYPFVLDADVSAGENDKGEYAVFVEIERNEKIAEQIKDLTYGLERLTGISDWKFKYYKNKEMIEASTENLKKSIPASSRMYEAALHRMKTENIKSFFSKTLMDDLTIENDIITIHKPFDVKVQLQMVSEDDPQTIHETLADTIAADQDSVSEILWLTKVLGNYNIDKFGDKFLFTNENRALLLKRV
jgi:DNA-dependent RNA polymerase auxiliary subunit epsilon